MPYIFLYLFLAVLCLLNMQFCPTGADIKKTMNRLHELRFVFAVLIIFSHCTNPFFPMPHILLPLSKISTLGVGYFFISSGFGLACSVASKPNYLRNFWKKIVDLLWITLFSSVVSTLIRNTMLGEHQIFQLVNWYMPTLTVLYLIFYVSHRIFPKNKFRRVVFLSGVIFIITAILCIFDAVTGLNHRVYYISELAFPFGVIIYEYADFFAAFLKKICPAFDHRCGACFFISCHNRTRKKLTRLNFPQSHEPFLRSAFDLAAGQIQSWQSNSPHNESLCSVPVSISVCSSRCHKELLYNKRSSF